MRVLVTGGTGLIGKPTIDALLARGHTVVLFSRHAKRDRRLWKERVEAHPGSVARDEDVRGAAEDCDAVLHIAGIVEEIPPEITFHNVNVEGTRRLVREAERAGVRRFVYVSSLGAERGSSGYHRSKREGENIVTTFAGDWLICRPGNVYGPGDQVISLLLKMVRALPMVPVMGAGDRTFQPIWVDDLATALALAVERDTLSGDILELAGAERVSMEDLLEQIGEITGRSPPRVPVPEWVALAGADLAERIGMRVPVQSDQIVMLLEENVILPGHTNALTEVFDIDPKPIAAGIEELADALPEKLPSEGVGDLHRQRYWADIVGSRFQAEDLLGIVRREFYTLVPEALLKVGAEPGTPLALEEGATLTMEVPLRGHIQVRVEEIEPLAITCMTVEGHHLAGVIRYLVEDGEDRVRFEVRSYTRASRLLDQIGMVTLGKHLQKETWRSFVEAVVERSGGEAPEGIQNIEETVPDSEARRVERWAREVVLAREREE